MTTNTVLAFLLGIGLLLAFIAAAAVFKRLRALAVTKFGTAPFQARPVMNHSEVALYRRLLRVAPHGMLVMPQVQMSGFLKVRGLTDRQERWKYLNRIIRLSVDFLLVDGDTLMPVGGIELDGSTHTGGKAFVSGQSDADARKDQAMKAAGVPLLRISVKSALSDEALRLWLSSLAH